MNSTIRFASHKKYWYSDDQIILAKQLSDYFLDSEKNSQYNSYHSSPFRFKIWWFNGSKSIY